MKTIGDRIRHARELRGLNQTQLATMAGIKQPSMSDLETGATKEPMAATLHGIATATRVRYEWLASGEDPMEEDVGNPSLASRARETPLPYVPRGDLIEVPVFDVVASMGLGAAMPEHDTVVDHMRLTKSWVDRNIPGSISRQLAVISAYGDSMQPTFTDGDILLIDRSVMSLRLDAVYVLSFHDELYIKRIQRRPDGSIAIISDNKVYEPIVVRPEEKDGVRVLGRVLWAWNGKKL